MKWINRIFIVGILLFAGLSNLHAQNERNAKQVINDWPETAKKAANAMLDEYGQPDGVTSSMLIWNNTGPFNKTIVYKEEVDHDFPMPHKDVLEQFVYYEVPAEKFDELAKYDGSVIVERTKGVMSARCDKEAANYLALNLAHDIVNDQLTVEQARQMYADVIMQMLQDEKHPYVQDLRFQVASENAGFSDETVMDMSKVKRLKGKN